MPPCFENSVACRESDDSWQGFLIEEIFYRHDRDRVERKSRGIKREKKEEKRERERGRSVLYHSSSTFIRKSQWTRNKHASSCSYGRTQSNGAQTAAVLDDEWTEIDDSSWADCAKNWRKDINNGSFSRGNFNRWIRASKIYQTSSETCDLIRIPSPIVYVPSHVVAGNHVEFVEKMSEKKYLAPRQLDASTEKNSLRTSIKMLKPRPDTWQSADGRTRWPGYDEQRRAPSETPRERSRSSETK